jgi:hypothetical protein
MYAPIAASTNGDNTLVTGVSGRRIVVTGFALVFSGTVSAQFFSGPSSNAVNLTGNMPGVAQSFFFGAPVPPQLGTPNGHFVTNSGDGLVLKLSAGTAVAGWITYELIA